MSAERRGKRVRLGFGRVETADETGEGAASAVELEAVSFQRADRPVRQFEKDLVRLDRGQEPGGWCLGQRRGDARGNPIRCPRHLEPEIVLDIGDQLRRGKAHLRPDLPGAAQLHRKAVGQIG